MKYILLYLLVATIGCAELELKGWVKVVGNDVPQQKIIVFTKEVSVNDRDYKLTVTQVRNDDQWHWSQMWHIKNVNGKWDRMVWNSVMNDGRDIKRWYTYGKLNKACMVVGIAEKDEFKSVPEGRRYICFSFPSEKDDDKDVDDIFVDTGMGIFDVFPPQEESPKF